MSSKTWIRSPEGCRFQCRLWRTPYATQIRLSILVGLKKKGDEAQIEISRPSGTLIKSGSTLSRVRQAGSITSEKLSWVWALVELIRKGKMSRVNRINFIKMEAEKFEALPDKSM